MFLGFAFGFCSEEPIKSIWVYSKKETMLWKVGK